MEKECGIDQKKQPVIQEHMLNASKVISFQDKKNLLMQLNFLMHTGNNAPCIF
jgi:hypothetical protein